jgi:hypothetical protein
MMAVDSESLHSESKVEDYTLPPRSIVHPSAKGKLTRIFYSTIVTLFVLLILTLIGWFLFNSKQG